MKIHDFALIVVTILSVIGSAAYADEIWPDALYGKLSYEANEKFTRGGGTREVWHGGMGRVDDAGNRVGLVFWAGASSEQGMVASCFDDTATEDPEIVVYFGEDIFTEQSYRRKTKVFYQYDFNDTQEAMWAVIEPLIGGVYITSDGDSHLRNMIAGSRFFLTKWRESDSVAFSPAFSLIGFTKEFEKACNWHPNYEKWITGESSRDIAPVGDKEETIESKILSFSKQEHPDNTKMQKYVYQKQMSAFNYISNVADQEVKEFAEQKYPNDYAMQQFVYDKQVADKRYMQNVNDTEVKEFSIREHRNDYSMQKFSYDKQLAAKEFMNSVSNIEAKNSAMRRYPNDYSMQKFTYEKIIY